MFKSLYYQIINIDKFLDYLSLDLIYTAQCILPEDVISNHPKSRTEPSSNSHPEKKQLFYII